MESQKIILTSDKVWDPHEVAFPGTSEADISIIESYNLSMVKSEERTPIEGYGDGYDRPLQIFNIRAFNARIIGSTVIPTRVSTGPLAEDKLLSPPSFISSQRHSNTTPEDLSEVWNISVEQAKLTLEATTEIVW